MFVSALLSLVLSIRNKLSALGYSHVSITTLDPRTPLTLLQTLPKDPFLHPHAFSTALSSYISSTSSHSSTLSQPTTSPATLNVPSFIGSGHHHLPLPPLASTVTTTPFSTTALLNPGTSFPSPQPSFHNSANTTQTHLASTPAALTRELVESIESAYAKRVASMNEPEGSSLSGGLGSSIVGVGGGGTGSPVVSPSSGLHRDANSGGAGPSGSGLPKSQARQRVKRVLKGKLDDFTSAVSTATDHHHYDGGELGDGGRDDRGVVGGGGGGGLSGGEADGNPSVGTSGGQIFRGMGNLILSGASGITGGTANGAGGPTCIWDVNVDLEQFVISIIEKEGSSRKLGVRSRRKKGIGKGSESVDFGRGGGGGSGLPLAMGNSSSVGVGGRSNPGGIGAGMIIIPQSVVNGEYGVIVAMLWSGRVADVVALREWEKERERADTLGLGLPNTGSASAAGMGTSGVVSDGEEAKSEGAGGRSTEGEDSDLQMEGRLGGSFGGVWSERVQKKLGSWAG